MRLLLWDRSLPWEANRYVLWMPRKHRVKSSWEHKTKLRQRPSSFDRKWSLSFHTSQVLLIKVTSTSIYRNPCSLLASKSAKRHSDRFLDKAKAWMLAWKVLAAHKSSKTSLMSSNSTSSVTLWGRIEDFCHKLTHKETQNEQHMRGQETYMFIHEIDERLV